MEKEGYITKTSYYELKAVPGEYVLIDRETIKVLLDSGMDNIIKLYAVFKKMYESNPEEAHFNYEILKRDYNIGYVCQGRDNHKIKAMIDYLVENGMLKFKPYNGQGFFKYNIILDVRGYERNINERSA